MSTSNLPNRPPAIPRKHALSGVTVTSGPSSAVTEKLRKISEEMRKTKISDLSRESSVMSL